ncbi:STE family protein kinase [Tritrichomonas foetus]|uniref:STE family protein kinase n=1 Tax=Tritrichomonas foetus TaxID=1144522 RepID=A0A1J4KAG9_9EUKA|nr:STE family protein kinase [Tritrichomonas foetus]|eukprot:OHT06662.1 STE family protein kinase [Tritrichomonas foetus]
MTDDSAPKEENIPLSLEAHARASKKTGSKVRFVIDNKDRTTLEKKVKDKTPFDLPELDTFLRYDDPHEFLTNLNQIDSGSTSNIYTAKYNDDYICVKEMPLTPENRATLINETRIMSSTKSDNVVKFISAHLVNDSILYILMELMNAGSLYTIASNCQEIINEGHIAYFAREILKGLNDIHSKNRIHRDIKTDNVLLNMDGEVKIADFGFSAQLDKKKKRESIVGTPHWMAPELIQGFPYSFPVDIWGVGVLCRELVECNPPYHYLPPMKAVYEIVTHGLPELKNKEKFSNDFLSFLDSCLQQDPAKRGTIPDLLKHPFLEKACGKEEIHQLIEAGYADNGDE